MSTNNSDTEQINYDNIEDFGPSGDEYEDFDGDEGVLANEGPDLRKAEGIRILAHYPIGYLNYAQGYGTDSKYKNCVKMMIIEKQTKYPTYTEQFGDAVYKLVTWISKFDITGGTGADIVANSAQLIGKGMSNARISEISQNPAEYWGQRSYINRFKDLFVTETEKGIITYEVPFFSEYWVETDGEAGWKRPGAEMMLGKNMSNFVASMANVGFPSTPDWEFTPHYPSLKVEFHLINDTIEHLENHLRWLNSFTTGQMYVQVDYSGLADAMDKAKEKVEGNTKLNTKQKQSVNKLSNAVKQVLANYSTLYKSPNVYEIIVPGRLRWLWSTISAEVTCVGKLYAPGGGNDGTKLRTGLKAYDDVLSAFPEAFKVSVDIRSLVPQAFNTYYYFLTTDQTQGTNTNAMAAAQQAWDILKTASKDTIETLKSLVPPSIGEILSKWING